VRRALAERRLQSVTDPHHRLVRPADRGPHHTDAEREYAYDRASSIGKLDKALDEANARNWSVVDMKRDWSQVFPPAK